MVFGSSQTATISHRHKVQAVCSIQIKTDRDAVARISPVVQVIPVVVIVDVNVIVVVPVVRPIFWPRIYETEPISAVLKTPMTANIPHWQAVYPESVILAVVPPKPVVRNTVADISAALLPRAMLGLPTARPISTPRNLLTANLLGSSLLYGPTVAVLAILLIPPASNVFLTSHGIILADLLLLTLLILLLVGDLPLLSPRMVALLLLNVLLTSGLLLPVSVALLALLLLLPPSGLLILFPCVVPLFTPLSTSGLLLLTGVALWALLVLLYPGLLRWSFRLVFFLLPSRGIAALFLILMRRCLGCSPVLVFMLAIWLGLPFQLCGLAFSLLLVRFVLTGICEISEDKKSKKCGGLNYSNLFHGVTSTALTLTDTWLFA